MKINQIGRIKMVGISMAMDHVMEAKGGYILVVELVEEHESVVCQVQDEMSEDLEKRVFTLLSDNDR
ncbi:MAG: hypothetical protein Q8874_02765, partial [Sweet potato little leaf phytoplasma]|nr:hypothetical protein [Sweet potato little leaf phytoplasma]